MEETYNLIRGIKGEFTDEIIRYSEDSDEIVEIIQTPITSNIITTPISILMAGLIQGLYLGNNSYWAIGTGTQASSPNLTNLVSEYSRLQVTIQFVDQSNSVSATPTSKLAMGASWGKGVLGTVTLSEFGIFSGTNANLANGGLMMDYVPHAPISLDLNTALSRKIYFQF
jgi:hypothetical protein